jgi:N utilization substance protein A
MKEEALKPVDEPPPSPATPSLLEEDTGKNYFGGHVAAGFPHPVTIGLDYLGFSNKVGISLVGGAFTAKIAVHSNDEGVDAQGACIGQKGVRVRSITEELHGEQIDIIPWSAEPAEYVAHALAPARVLDITVNTETHQAQVSVADDQLSLAIGKGGQNVRLAAKLTGWKIDIKGIKGEEVNEQGNPIDEEGFTSITDYVANESELTQDAQ